jgi:hypothetical protein
LGRTHQAIAQAANKAGRFRDLFVLATVMSRPAEDRASSMPG